MDALDGGTGLVVTGVLVLVLAGLHLFVGRFHFRAQAPRSRFLSFAGGWVVGFVFLGQMPALAAAQVPLARALTDSLAQAAQFSVAIYLVALAGTVMVYGVDTWAAQVDEKDEAAILRGRHPAFWFHIALFATFNAIVGYLLVTRAHQDTWVLILYTIAMALLLGLSDASFRHRHPLAYDRGARWILAGAIIAGWLVSVITTLPPLAVEIARAFLVGTALITALRDQIPSQQTASFGWFLAGAAVIATIMLVTI